MIAGSLNERSGNDRKTSYNGTDEQEKVHGWEDGLLGGFTIRYRPDFKSGKFLLNEKVLAIGRTALARLVCSEMTFGRTRWLSEPKRSIESARCSTSCARGPLGQRTLPTMSLAAQRRGRSREVERSRLIRRFGYELGSRLSIGGIGTEPCWYCAESFDFMVRNAVLQQSLGGDPRFTAVLRT